MPAASRLWRTASAFSLSSLTSKMACVGREGGRVISFGVCVCAWGHARAGAPGRAHLGCKVVHVDGGRAQLLEHGAASWVGELPP